MGNSSKVSSAPRSSELTLRGLVAADRPAIARILEATAAFNADEIAVALELVDEHLEGGDQSGYSFVVGEAEVNGAREVLGYSCFGATPLTEGVFDLYWIAVHPKTQGHGVGRVIMQGVDEAVRRLGGRMVLIETAGKPSYAATRAFYERTLCDLVATVPDFYAVGDDKLIYARRLR